MYIKADKYVTIIYKGLDWKDLKGNLVLTTLPQAETPLEDRVAPRSIQPGLQYCQGGGAPTASLGSLCQCLSTLTAKYFFLPSNLNLPSFSLKPLPLSYPYTSW